MCRPLRACRSSPSAPAAARCIALFKTPTAHGRHTARSPRHFHKPRINTAARIFGPARRCYQSNHTSYKILGSLNRFVEPSRNQILLMSSHTFTRTILLFLTLLLMLAGVSLTADDGKEAAI